MGLWTTHGDEGPRHPEPLAGILSEAPNPVILSEAKDLQFRPEAN